MEILSKPVKFGRFQITKILDKFGDEKIEIKYFMRHKGGGLNYNKYHFLYLTPEDWKEFKKKIKKK